MRIKDMPWLDISPLPIPRRSFRVGAQAFVRKISRWLALRRLDGELETAEREERKHQRLARIGMEQLEYTDAEDYCAQCREVEFNRQQQSRAARTVLDVKLRIRTLERERNR
jgi:hypothetical protein